jgi:hypothetical protein
MSDTINEANGKVQIIFEYVDTGNTNLSYRDALWFTSNQYSTITQSDIDTMKQERINNWLSIVNPTT